MATPPGPRPKRKDYLTKTMFEFALSAWQDANNLFQVEKEQERQQRAARRSQPRQRPQGRSQRSNRFGTGEVGGDNRWTPPVHGMTEDGQPVTASFGRDGTSREGHTLISDGHAEEPDDFYGPTGEKKHDHFGPHGEPYGDRGQSSD